MGRNRKQEAALQQVYSAKRDETRSAFERALLEIADLDDSVLTEKALYSAAHRSRATLNRYPDIKAKLASLREERRRQSGDRMQREESHGPTVSARLKVVQAERDALAQRVAILSMALRDLERRNASLANLLHRNHVDVPMELVISN